MPDAGLRGELLLERVDVRPERRDPVRVDRVLQELELAAGQMRGRQVDPRHCGETTEREIITRWRTLTRMIFLGFGKYARADKIYALEPIDTSDRGSGRRTRVWVEGVADPIVASRTERTILHEMGHDHGADSAIIDEALGLAERLSEAADQGKVDLGDLGRRAKRLLEKTAKPEDEKLF